MQELKRRSAAGLVVFVCATLFLAAASAQTFEPNVRRPGLDYRSVDLPKLDARLCQKACIDELACLAWAYDATQGPPPLGKCWLKYAIPRAWASDCCTSGVVRSAAGMKIAHAKEVFEKRGLLGTFATDCSKPVSGSNHYIVFRAIDGERIQSDTMLGPTERGSVYVGEVATESGPNLLTIHGVMYETRRLTYTLLVDGKRWRSQLMFLDNGENSVMDGLWQGKETPWYTKCD
jgi:PAN domain